MPLTKAGLSASIVTALGAKTGAGIAIQQDFADAIADAIVTYIKDNMVVNVTIPVLPVSTAGSAAAQTGATNAPVPVTGTVT